MTRGVAAESLVIYGAGGHGQVVAAAAIAAGWDVLGFIDDAGHSAGEPWDPNQLPILDKGDSRLVEAGVCPAVGDNQARERCANNLPPGRRLARPVIHPTAWVDPSAQVEAGSFVGARAVVNAGVNIGPGVIVNTAAVVEHHARIDAFAHIAPGAVLGGQVGIGRRALVGLGARLLPRIEVGADAVLGAGAVVTRDVPANQTVVGVPAK